MLRNRVYTNVILTVIAILLALTMLSPPSFLITSAQARDEEQRAKQLSVNVSESAEVAAATREVAAANRSIANAIQALAESVDRVSDAVGKSQ